MLLITWHGTIKVWRAAGGWVWHQDCGFQQTVFLKDFTIIICFWEYADASERTEAKGWEQFFIYNFFQIWCFCGYVNTWFDYGSLYSFWWSILHGDHFLQTWFLLNFLILGGHWWESWDCSISWISLYYFWGGVKMGACSCLYGYSVAGLGVVSKTWDNVIFLYS